MIKDPKTHCLPYLFNYLAQYCIVSEDYKAAYYDHVSVISVKKNKYLLSPIDHNACLYYLVNGLVRGFVKVGKKDITTWFSFGNEIIGAFRNPNGNAKHSTEYIQALEDAELICIPYKLIDFLYDNFAEANIIGRKMLAHQYYLASERAILARIPLATERYRAFEEISKMELLRIPLRYMATYLGMRLETLSRIRNKLTYNKASVVV